MQTLPNLPASVSREVFATLCASLPPPVTDTPEARAAREETAMAAVAALLPANAYEALLAAEIVAANYNAKDCLRLAVQPGQDPDDARRIRAQANAMMRQEQSGLRALQRTQATREKAEAERNPAAMQRAGYWFKDVSVPLPEPSPAQPEPSSSADPSASEFTDLTEAEQTPRSTPSAPPASAPTAACRPASTSARPNRISSTPWSPAPAPFSKRSIAAQPPPPRPDRVS